MVDYKDTGRYEQVEDTSVPVYVGIEGQVDYSGKSTRVDDNFTNIAQNISNGQAYTGGTGISVVSNSISVKYDNDTIKIDGSGNLYIPTISYNDLSDTLTAGDNISIVNNVISATDTTYSAATTDTAGLMSALDKQKLDSLTTYSLPIANTTTLGGIKPDGTTIIVDNETGIASVPTPTIPDATTSVSGLMSATDKAKLNGIHPSANYTYAGTTNGYISINDNIDGVLVYTHPSYTAVSIEPTVSKIINGITIDATGHVTDVSYTISGSDTWRPIKVNGVQYLNSSTATSAVNFKNGSNVNIVYENGSVVINSLGGSGSSTVYGPGAGISLVTVSEYQQNITLNKATTQVLGGVIVGTGLSVDGDGVLTCDASYTAGDGIDITSGVLSVKYDGTTIKKDTNTGELYVDISDSDTTYTGSNSIDIDSSNAISVKISSATGNAATVNSTSGEEGLYVSNNPYTAGEGIAITSGVLSVNYDTNTLEVDRDNVLAVKLSRIREQAITDTTGEAVSLTVNNNYIYRYNNVDGGYISSFTISGVVQGFQYATITFTCSSTAATFVMPSTGYYCAGADCDSNGDFVPVADMRYNLAVMQEGDRIAIYVMRALND